MFATPKCITMELTELERATRRAFRTVFDSPPHVLSYLCFQSGVEFIFGGLTKGFLSISSHCFKHELMFLLSQGKDVSKGVSFAGPGHGAGTYVLCPESVE